MLTIDPLLPKATFANARGCSTRTIDRMVSQRRIPRGEPINGTAVGWRASLVNLTLAELTELAKAQSEQAAAEQDARAAKMRKIGAKGGRQNRKARLAKGSTHTGAEAA